MSVMVRNLYVIDGHAQIYRAYHAMSGLVSRTGEPTNATFGFVSALFKLLQSRQPDYVALAMDAGSSNRDQIDSEYKAQRKPMPEDMPPQIQRISQIVSILEIPILRVDGCEADDVIATLVRRLTAAADKAGDEKINIYICSRDKDLDQLICDNVFLYDIQTAETVDAAALLQKKGYSPRQACDVLALTGDTADNIPGIPGVGPKTAAKWISQYGNLDNLLTHAAEIPGKVGEALRNNMPVLAKSRQLVRLLDDLPLDVELDKMRPQPQKLQRLAPVFHELDFNRLLPLLPQVAHALDHSLSPGVAVGPASPTPVTPRLPTTGKAPPAEGFNLFNQPTENAPSPSVDAPRLPLNTDPAAVLAATTESAPPAASATGSVVNLMPVQGDYRLINTPQLLAEMVRDLQEVLAASPHRWLAVDTETDALGAMRSNLCGISLCARRGLAWYLPVLGLGDCLTTTQVRAALGPILADESIIKVGQNLKYDLNVLRNCGMELAGPLLDTMVAGYVLDAARRSHSMDAMAADFLGLRPIPISDLIGKGANQLSFAQVPLPMAAGYSAEDADVTFRLADHLIPQIRERQFDKLYFELEMPIMAILADMEFFGVKVDTSLLGVLAKEVEARLVALHGQILTAAGETFNPDSPKQLAAILFTKLGLPVIKKTKTGPSTDVDVLEALADKHPVPALILEYRQMGKLKSTYIDALAQQVSPRTGRVHTSFNQTVAETGRLSSSDPNLQNIPIRTAMGREIRRAFVAQNADWVLLAADYSQIELRVFAHFCQEPALLAAFAADQDIHQFVATQIYHVNPQDVTSDMRRLAKTVNFGIIYGQTAFGLAQVLKIPRHEAEVFINAYKARFPGIDAFSRQCIQQAMLHGFVTTILGRRRNIPEIHSTNQSVRQFGQRAAVNTVVQGSAADLIKQAMVKIDHALAGKKDEIRLIMQVHDELVFECRRDCVERNSAVVRREMENAIALSVPLKVEIGWADNWLEAK